MTVHTLGILDCTTWLGLSHNAITGKACMQTASHIVGNVWCVRRLKPVLMRSTRNIVAVTSAVICF